MGGTFCRDLYTKKKEQNELALPVVNPQLELVLDEYEKQTGRKLTRGLPEIRTGSLRLQNLRNFMSK